MLMQWYILVLYMKGWCFVERCENLWKTQPDPSEILCFCAYSKFSSHPTPCARMRQSRDRINRKCRNTQPQCKCSVCKIYMPRAGSKNKYIAYTERLFMNTWIHIASTVVVSFLVFFGFFLFNFVVE